MSQHSNVSSHNSNTSSTIDIHTPFTTTFSIEEEINANFEEHKAIFQELTKYFDQIESAIASYKIHSFSLLENRCREVAEKLAAEIEIISGEEARQETFRYKISEFLSIVSSHYQTTFHSDHPEENLPEHEQKQLQQPDQERTPSPKREPTHDADGRGHFTPPRQIIREEDDDGVISC